MAEKKRLNDNIEFPDQAIVPINMYEAGSETYHVRDVRG